MEGQNHYFSSLSPQKPRPNKSVKIELAGISPTSSPSLEPSNSRLTRRRSWGNRAKDEAEPNSEPLHIELDVPVHLDSPTSLSPTSTGTSVMPTLDADSVHLLADDQVRRNARRGLGQRNAVTEDMFNSTAGSSMVPLMSSQHAASSHSEADIDDRLGDGQHSRLTSEMSLIRREESLGAYSSSDPEHEGGASPRTRRKSQQYKLSSSPLRTTETVMKSVSKNIRRMSLRVVNLANNGLDGQLRLRDGDDGDRGDAEDDDEEVPPEPDLKQLFPLRGYALGFLGPENKFRRALFKFIVHPFTEPLIFILIILHAVILTKQSFPSLTLPADGSTPPTVKGYFHTWEDYVLFVLFVVFTVEALSRICVTGFLFDPEVSMFAPFSSRSSETHGRTGASNMAHQSRGNSVSQRIRRFWYTLRRPFLLPARQPTPEHPAYPMSTIPRGYGSGAHLRNDSVAGLTELTQRVHASAHQATEPTYHSIAGRSGTQSESITLPFRLSIDHLHNKTHRNVPYLRQSWSRIDFVAIVSFWISFGLAMAGLERGSRHIGIFRAMSVIRTARLLTITAGTTTILRSLKIARPLIARVAYFVLFSMVLFSIIGVQSFKGSLRRTCHISPTLGEDEHVRTSQFCGGHIDPVTLNVVGYVQLNNQTAPTSKGYICPLGQTCQEGPNPQQGIESFDVIYASALQVVIVAGANGWSPLMYSVIDSDFYVSCLFFIMGLIILNFWIINLFVAVITNTFAAIRSETRSSAFGASLVGLQDNDGWLLPEGRKLVKRPNLAHTILTYTKWVWVLLALVELVLQATRTVNVSPTHELVMFYGELAITIAFDVELVLRIVATLPSWRTFYQEGRNWLDAILAIGSTIIQIPVIRQSPMYPWFTIFQLGRFYRVILVIPRMKPLLLSVFGNVTGIANMVVFLLIVNYISALVAVQLLRGDYNSQNYATFGEAYNSFLSIYQVFSSENWPDILYGAGTAEIPFGQTVIVLIFITAWFLFGNFILLQMFIAVIHENFQIAEEQKKGKQATHYYTQQKARRGHVSWFRRLNPYRWIKASPEKATVSNLPSNLILPMQKALVQDYSMSRSNSRSQTPKNPIRRPRLLKPQQYSSRSLTALLQLFAGESTANDISLNRLHHDQERTFDPLDEEMERHLEFLASVDPDAGLTRGTDDELHELRAQRADFIRNHPTYDKVFWFIGQKNRLRKLCQKVVQPSRGERIFGKPPSPVAHPIFQLIILLTVIGGIVVESIATPMYRRNYFQQHGLTRGAWFAIAESTFGFVLFVEFLIKVLADGFVLTPNGYLHSIWNCLDFVIMIGIIVNVTTGLIFIGGLSRVTRSLKALRALRLITLIDVMRNTFGTLIIYGAMQIVDAAILAILYMIPYAVWGLNIFNGRMHACNDTSVGGLGDCVSEYVNTVYDNAFGFPVPRVWDYPAPSTIFSFDSFRASLLILFEIVSLEGWIDVMRVASSITGPNQQPQNYASPGNAIFFLIYNLLGGVVVLTIFVSLIIGNFRAKTGTDLMTKDQREWIDLQKLLRRQKPSKRPTVPTGRFRKWCYDRAVHKHGWWWIMMTVVFIVHIIALMTQTFTNTPVVENLRNDIFIIIMLMYIIDVVIRCYGLGWKSFRANGWNLFDIVVSIGSFVTTLSVRFAHGGFGSQQLQKLFLVSIAFKLVERTNSLNMLFKTAVAGLPAILSLLGLWIVLFIFFAILYIEVFGLTRWGTSETPNINYHSLGNALLMLSFQSTGEGWNQYMHDFTLAYPRCTSNSKNESQDDCGSAAWSLSLFIAWNLLSMYIFVNMFVGLVVDNFSFVFQTSSGGSKSISRDQMRAFKKVWAQFSNPKTRYLERHRFAAFFSKLSGVFEVRIFPLEYNVRNILALCKESPDTQQLLSPLVPGVDLNKMERILNDINYAEIRKRRSLYCRLFHEACISHEPGRGISFTDMLLLLAHHKFIVDAEALVLQDLVARTETNKLVTDLVNLDRVRSLLKTISLRRQFLKHLEKKRSEKFEKEIPSIVVMETPPMSSRDIASAGLEHSPGSPTLRFTSDNTMDTSVGSHLQRSRRTSDMSAYSMDISKLRPVSIAGSDAQDIVTAMHNTVWGDLMSQAVEEERGNRLL